MYLLPPHDGKPGSKQHKPKVLYSCTFLLVALAIATVLPANTTTLPSPSIHFFPRPTGRLPAAGPWALTPTASAWVSEPTTPTPRRPAAVPTRQPSAIVLRQFIHEAFPERRWRQIARPVRNLPPDEAYVLNRQLLRECVEDLEVESPSGFVVHAKLDALYNLWEVTPRGGEIPKVELERLFFTLEEGAKYFTEYYCARVTEDLWRMCDLDPQLYRQLLEPPGQRVLQVIGRRAVQPDVLPLFGTTDAVAMIATFGLLNFSCPETVQAVGDRLAEPDLLAGLTGPQAAATVKGLALTGTRHPVLLDSLAARVCRGSREWFPLLSQLQRDDILTLIRGYGALKHRSEALLLALARLLLRSGTVEELRYDEVADIAAALGRLRVYEEGMVALTATRTMAELPEMDPPSLGKVARAFARLDLLDEALMGGIAERAIQEPVMREFDPTSVADLLWSFARLGLQHAALTTSLIRRLTAPGFLVRCCPEVVHDVVVALVDGGLLRLLPPDDLLNTLVAFAAARLPADRLVAELVRLVVEGRLVARLDAAGVARLAVACAAAGLRDPPLVAAVVDRLLTGALLRGCSPAQAADFAQFFVAAEVRRPEALAGLADGIDSEAFLRTASGPDIARLAAAVRWLPPAPAALLRRLAPPATEEGRLAQCSAEDLVALAEAFAGEGFNDTRVLDAVAQHTVAAGSLRAFDTAQMARLVAAFAAVGHRRAGLLDAVGEQLGGHGRAEELQLPDVLRLLAACATLGHRDAALAQLLAARLEALGGPAALDGAERAAVAGQLAAVRMRSPDFLRALADDLVAGNSSRSMDPGQLVSVAWACASLAFSADGLTAALCAAAADRQFVRALTLRQVGRLAWALAAFDARDDPALEALLGVMLRVERQPPGAVPPICPLPLCQSREDCAQLHQTVLHVRLNAVRLPRSSQRLAAAEDVLRRCATAFAVAHRRPESPLQRDVLESIRRLTAEGQERVLLRDTGGYAADALFSADRLVVEVLDEDAYVNTARLGIKPSGHVALRHRQLQQLKYRVVPLPFYQWGPLAGPEERRMYLRRLFLDNLQRLGAASGGGGG